MTNLETLRFKIGDFSCLAINDGGTAGRADMLFANAPAADLTSALERHNEAAGALPSPWTCMLIEAEGQIVLIDTGEGNALGMGGGKLAPALRAEGVEPQQIDTVVLTHGHVDHIGGCLDDDDRPRFSNARHLMSESELAFWVSEETLAQLPAWMSEPARRVFPRLAGRIDTFSEEIEIVPGLRLLAAPGHTVGHVAVEITSGQAKLLNIVDAALHPIHVEHPEWVSRMDQSPSLTTATRKALFERAAADNALVLAYHFAPFPSLGHILAEGDGWRWVPAAGIE